MGTALHHFFRWYFLLSVGNVLFCTWRILEHVDFQPKMNATTATFRGIFSDLAHFFFVLFVVVTGFAFMGFLLLGAQVRSFLHFSEAMYKTWQMVFGTFKLKDAELAYVEPVVAEAFTFIFKIIVIVLLLKMVLAIIFESYKNVKKKTADADGVQDDFALIWWHLT